MRKKGIRNKEDNLKWGYRFKSALGNTYFNVLKLLDDYMIDEDEIYRYSGLKLLITKDSLLLGSCPIHGSNYHSYYYNTLCMHTLALMLLADDYIVKYNPGDDTDMNGDKVLNAYRKIISNKIFDETSQKKNVVRVEPKLSYGRNSAAELALTFRIDIEKLFKVKSLN